MDRNSGYDIILQGNLRRLIPKSIVYPGTRVGIGLGIGFGAEIILHQNCIAHTHMSTNPFESIHISSFVPPTLMEGLDEEQGC